MTNSFIRWAAVCLLAGVSGFAQTVHNGDFSVEGAFNAAQSTSSRPFLNVTSDPSGACALTGAATVNTGIPIATAGDIEVCVNGLWQDVAGPSLLTYTPTQAGGVSRSLSTLLTNRWINAASFGVSPANATNDTQLTNAMTAAFDLNNPGLATPTDVLLPCGTLQFANHVQPPPYVHLSGCGAGDSKQASGPLGHGTTLQATAAFASKTFPDNMLVMLGGSGPTSTEYFRLGISNVDIDSNGYGGGLMVANCQEQCTADHIKFDNFVTYGFLDWGANNNGNASATNAPWGLPANYQGSANDGPYSNFEFYPYGSATANTIPIVLANVAGMRGMNGFTIATNNPGQASGTQSPNVCGMFWGSSFTVSNGHCEGPKDGFIIGPSGGVPSQYGDGADQVALVNLQMSTPQITTGCTVRLQTPKGVTLSGMRGGQTAVICDDQHGKTSNASFFVEDYHFATNFFPTISALDGLNLDTDITTSTNVNASILNSNSVKIESPTPFLIIQQSAGSPGTSYPYTNITESGPGDLAFSTGGNGGGNFLFQNGSALELGGGAAKAGLNISAPLAFAQNVMGLIGNNLYYDSVNNVYTTSSNGVPDANGLLFGRDGMTFVGSNIATPVSQFTPAQVLAWTSAQFNNNGTTVFGNANVSGFVSSFTNASGTCSVSPSATALVCSSDARLKKNVEPVENALNKVLLLKPVTFNWTKEEASAAAHPGFIAQDVDKLYPQLVSVNDGFLQLNEQGLIPYTVKAVQEQQQEIVDLRAEIAELKKAILINSAPVPNPANVVR